MAQAARPKTDPNKTLAAVPPDIQDTPTQQDLIRETPHVRTRTQRNKTNRYGGFRVHPEYQPFAEALRQAMINGKLSASEVARRVWGTSKDSRGYTVAKNRDRLGHYLNGTSYPEPENLQKLADAIGIPVEELKIERPNSNPGPSRRRSSSLGNELHMGPVLDQPDKIRLQVQIDQIVDTSLAKDIIDLYLRLKPTESDSDPQLGDVIKNEIAEAS